MSTAASRFPSGADEIALLDPDTIHQILTEEAEIEWPDGASVDRVRVERVWPTRDGRFVFEWSFRLIDDERYALFAETGPCSDVSPAQMSNRARLSPHGLRDVMVPVPRWNLFLFSPDRDPGMGHLTRCLDEGEMAERLAPYWGGPGKPRRAGVSPITCRPLAYRAGKRAAIAYEGALPDGQPRRLLGKTFCDDRADRLRRRHLTLNEKLAESTGGRVRVTTPIGLLPELRMLLFAWSGEEGDAAPPARDHGTKPSPGAPGGMPAACRAVVGVEALLALHRTPMEGMPDFSMADECAVVKRWHGVLSRLAPELAVATGPLVDSLIDASTSVKRPRTCTLHRDFYERQIICCGETTTLLDLDTLARGDPAVDLGNYLTHVVLEVLQAEDATGSSTATAEMMVGGYVASGGVLARNALAFYWASSLFRVGAVHAVRSRSRKYSPLLWKLADDLLCYMEFEPEVRVPDNIGVSALPDARTILEGVPL